MKKEDKTSEEYEKASADELAASFLREEMTRVGFNDVGVSVKWMKLTIGLANKIPHPALETPLGVKHPSPAATTTTTGEGFGSGFANLGPLSPDADSRELEGRRGHPRGGRGDQRVVDTGLVSGVFGVEKTV